MISNAFQYDENNALYMKKYAFTALFFLAVLLLHPTNSHAQTGELANPSPTDLSSIEEFLLVGDELRDAGKYEEAIVYYDKVLAIDPTDLDALLRKGLALDDLGKIDEAILYYDKVIAIDPTDIFALYNKALALDNLGKLDEAISYYDKVLEIDPTDTDALYNKGLILDNLGKLDEAISYYDKVLAIDPNDVGALYHKGFALDRTGRYSEAVTYYDRVLAINPNDADALNNRNLAAGKQDVNWNISLPSDATLLVAVGIFVLLIISIIIIDLAANKRRGKIVAKTLVQTQPSTENQFKDKEKEEKFDDGVWKGI